MGNETMDEFCGRRETASLLSEKHGQDKGLTLGFDERYRTIPRADIWTPRPGGSVYPEFRSSNERGDKLEERRHPTV